MVAFEDMFVGIVNSPSTIISSDITDSAVTIPVIQLGVFPDAPNLATIGSGETAETIHYAAKSAASGSGNLTGVTREYDKSGTYGAKSSWNAGDSIRRWITFKDFKSLQDNITALNNPTGTSSATFQLESGSSGSKLKNDSGELQARNAADDAYADFRALSFYGDGSNLTGVGSAAASSLTGLSTTTPE